MPYRKRMKEALRRDSSKCQKIDGFFNRPATSDTINLESADQHSTTIFASDDSFSQEKELPINDNHSDIDNDQTHSSVDSVLRSVFDIGEMLHVKESEASVSKVVDDMADDMKYKLLRHHYEPDTHYTFQTTKQHGCNRRCKLEYLDNNFKYSVSTDSIFCLPCTLFVPTLKRHTLQSFVNRGYNKWSNVKDKERQHCETEYHKQAHFEAEKCIARFEQPESTLPFIVNDEMKIRYDKYYKILLRVAQVVHFCGRQGIALRGHIEPIISINPDINPGNFLALLREFAKDDKVLLDHMTTPISRNALYLRPCSQNEMIEVIGRRIIQANLLSEIKDAEMHGIMVDEVTANNDEIVSICFRFVDRDNNIREEFLDFVEVDRITGKAIAKTILDFYDRTGLSIKQLRSQCYDGASNMSSEKKGVSGIIGQHAPSAPYIHCCSHVLNLSIAASCKDCLIQHVVATVKAIDIFFTFSPKREKLLEAVAAKRNVQNTTRKVLKDMCKTRWSERDTAYEHFYISFPFITESLEIMNATHPELDQFGTDYTRDWSAETKRDATAYLRSLCDFGFIVGLVSLYYLLHPLHGITVKLQGRNVDIIKAYQEVDSALSDLKAVRSDIESQFDRIYAQAERMARDISVSPSLPRTVTRQIHRQNTPADTPREYYRRIIAIPLLDSIITEIEVRFDKMSRRAVKLLALVPSISCDPTIACDIDEAIEMFKGDLDHPNLVQLEMDSWKRKWICEAAEKRPSTLAASIQGCDATRYPNLYKLLRVACTFGVTSCECERSFSAMRRLKPWLRSTMSNDRLASLALMNIHYGHNVDYNEAVSIFMKLHPRRIKDASLFYSQSKP